MAKKAGSSDFNMSAEIRNLLAENKDMTGREVVNALRERFPKQSINEGSASVAFANARRKLGINTVRKKRPVGKGAKAATRPWTAVAKPAASAAAPAAAGMELLSAAKHLLKVCGGDAALAASAIKQLAALQIS